MNLQVSNCDRARQKEERNGFWVSPPQRYVINRHSPKVVPHNLSVIVGVGPNIVEPRTFFQSIAPFTNDKLCGVSPCNNNIGLMPDHISMSSQEIPSVFKVQVYVWDDTTMREVLEEVLASSLAARHVLLPAFHESTATMTPEEEENKMNILSEEEEARKNVEEEGKTNKGRENGLSEDTKGAVENNGQYEPDDEGGSSYDNEGDDAPVLKRDRTEVESESQLPKHPPPPTERTSNRWRGRPMPMPVAKVRVCHVFAPGGKEPKIRDITQLRVDKPIFHVGDRITMQELRTASSGVRGWKNGDLLLIVPTVQHYKPKTAGDAAV